MYTIPTIIPIFVSDFNEIYISRNIMITTNLISDTHDTLVASNIPI